MNGSHDPHGHKRTSITQLLNPVAATPGPALDAHTAFPNSSNYSNNQYFAHHQMPPLPYQPAAAQPAHFKLTAASWEANGSERRRQEIAYPPPNYPQSGNAPPGMYPEHSSRVNRPREDAAQQQYEPPVWQNGVSHEANVPSYNQYSDERTPAAEVPLAAGAPSYSSPRSDSAYHRQQDGHAPSYFPQQAQSAPQYRAPAPQYYHPHTVPAPMPYNVGPYPGPPSAPGSAAVPPPAQPTPPTPSPAPTPSQTRKRSPPHAESEDTNGFKAKKAKTTRGKSSADNGGSRRGYNAKKRSEAAQIAAQNGASLYLTLAEVVSCSSLIAQLLPNVSYASMGIDKGKQKALDGAPSSESQGQLHPELQFARCMSNRYKSENFPRCVSCTRRWAGDTCRFQGIRFFLKDEGQNIVGISFVEHQKADAPSMNFPNRWNRSLDRTHIHEIKRTVAHALLPTLQEELKHLNMPAIIRRPRESDVRATCDTCMTSIFSSSWMCRQCGREACAECFAKVRELTQNRPGATDGEIAALQAKRESHAHTNPFFLSCTRRNEHQYSEFSPMSRFCKDELVQVIHDMEELLENLKREKEASTIASGSDPESSLSGEETVASTPLTWSGGAAGAAAPVVISADPLPPSNSVDENDPGLPSHTMPSYADGTLTEEEFRKVWKKGIPLMVTGVLDKFQIKWNPSYFMQKYQSQTCSIVECQTDANKRVTVGEFFKMFGAYEGRTECWKLKDWPSSTDFKTAFPELYEDFSKAVPMPNYCRRDGVLNIASHFPANTVAPDLGPKMYNAMSTSQAQGSKGSTRLHMDMADAVNIMLHTEPRADGSPGVAAWDLFRWEDADKLRKFLRRRNNTTATHQDPIHTQQIYLDATLRRELHDEYGVKSYRVYQAPGEAVFIPAGCAHQVANLSDTIKVAIDFVSPENIERCEKLTGEFREQNQSMVWKEDVLQLRTMMWFAWLSCARQEAEMV
ncbi:Clavaminate synthase-like protein [Auriscalpium vulgare]|uniref:Clavaminate synthase-like protein n=1 Tax=Auriscalpium vulgare TaxID=40419 RepID=A0ACB8RTA7_9AGAM|nr:Clavaminate synthase-like protein [Auriscalpium vulgare]